MRRHVLALGALLLAGCGGSDTAPALPEGKASAVKGSLKPSVHLFAEPVVARIDVVVDRGRIDPRNIRLDAPFKPYQLIGEASVARRDVGRFTHLRYELKLRCLGADCIPRTFEGEITVSQVPGLPALLSGQQRDEKRTYRFPATKVLYDDDAGLEPKVLGRITWPPLRSLSRINWSDSSVVGLGFPFESNVTPVSEPSFRAPPALLGAGLLGGALALLVLPAGLLVRYRRRRPGRDQEAAPEPTPLERALALVEWARGRSDAGERRGALEALAFELQAERGELADRAREQAWSRVPPSPDEMAELLRAVRENDGDD
ncbi:MAG: hypothetical protein HW413_111 [Thermoleophilia bacterium]|nr:hypothetical protein [Thermoleophilia bacterium]